VAGTTISLPLAGDWAISAFDNSPIGMVVTSTGGRLLRVNRALCEMLGYTHDELVHADWPSLTHPDDVAPTWELVHRLLEGTVSSVRIEKRYLARDGRVVRADLSSSLLRDGDGRPLYLVTHLVDVTARRQAEEERRLAAAEILDLYENAPCGYHSLGPDGTVLRMNATELSWLGYSREELVGRKTFADLVTPESLKVFQANYPGFKERGWVNDLLFDLVRKDGSVLPVILSATAVNDASGKYLLSRSTVFVDTLRKQAVRELERHREHLEELVGERTRELSRIAEDLLRSNRDLEQFAYVASHDLQEPLRMVASFVERLGEDYRGKLDPTADTYIRIASENSRRMQKLIQGLLAYARVGSRGRSFALSDAATALAEALGPLRSTIAETGAEISAEGLPAVHADATQLAELLRNLVENALAYRSGRPPRIRVSARREGGHWHFSVEDNGIGIEPRYYDRIFVIFQRLHAPSANVGTGIGLAICKKIVERHSGRIWVESEPGAGSTFHFTLPDREGDAA
jgi:PAS domain S-box-containing protein